MWRQRGVGAGVEQLTEKEEWLLKLIEGMSNVGGERRGTSMNVCKMACHHTFNLTLVSQFGLALCCWKRFAQSPHLPAIKTTSIVFLLPIKNNGEKQSEWGYNFTKHCIPHGCSLKLPGVSSWQRDLPPTGGEGPPQFLRSKYRPFS